VTAVKQDLALFLFQLLVKITNKMDSHNLFYKIKSTKNKNRPDMKQTLFTYKSKSKRQESTPAFLILKKFVGDRSFECF